MRSGSTNGPVGSFQMVAEDGGLLEAVMETLSDWLLAVEHSCNPDSVSFTKKFRLTSSKREGAEDGYFRVVGLEQAN